MGQYLSGNKISLCTLVVQKTTTKLEKYGATCAYLYALGWYGSGQHFLCKTLDIVLLN